MKKCLLILTLLFCGYLSNGQNFRPPAYPLVSVDPYFSIWSFNDTLNNGPTRHWTGKENSLQGIVRVDGRSYYFLGQPIAQYRNVLSMTEKNQGSWKYTLSKPGSGWASKDFDAAGWKTATGAFTDNKMGNGKWKTHDIWMRRTFNLKNTNFNQLMLKIQHDDGAKVYLNGVLASNAGGAIHAPVLVKISQKAMATLKKGENVLAIHCENTGGPGYIDAGLMEQLKSKLNLPKAEQIDVHISATQTFYQFKCGGVALNVRFTAPKLPDDLYLFSRPADYVTFKVQTTDGRSHKVQLYFSAAGNLAVNTPNQKVTWKRSAVKGMKLMQVGTASQNILGRKGDDVRIDWGYFYLGAPENDNLTTVMASSASSVARFVKKGKLDMKDDRNMPRAAGKNPVTLAASYDFGKISSSTHAKMHLILAYDDLYSIEFFHKNLKAWWKKTGISTPQMLEQANNDYSTTLQKCDQFDKKLADVMTKAGGEKYAKLCELAYRQSLAACKLAVGPGGQPYYFTKENFSNGDISTVDVIFPGSPLLLYYNPKLAEAIMNPVFYYCEKGGWDKPYSPHDLGTYPVANGRKVEEAMPIEESGNMIILSAALAHAEGNANYARKHWKVLTRWSDFLLKGGMDPKNQLTTDDFAGRSAHNANLSAKAIMAIACYGKLAGMLGKKELDKEYTDTAHRMAQKWIQLDQEGDHYKLTFDRPGTWSQKYNLVWDKVLKLNIFPKEVTQKAIAYYLTKQNKYGLPLDSRATYTKSDWINWTATMADDKATFEKFIAPLYKYVCETPDRIPMSDWYQTTNAKHVGFQARSVVGGYFMKALDEKWNK